MNSKIFQQIWDQLRQKKLQYSRFLEQINIRHLRGISDLTINFQYPVTVIAGHNACGKTTVLFACACAYEPQTGNPRNYTPATLFPNLSIKQSSSTLNDSDLPTVFEFYYSIDKKKQAMRWAKGKSWNKSYMGQKKGRQPQAGIYLRTLANLTSPSEVRSVLQIASNSNLVFEDLTSHLLAFAQRVLPMQYGKVTLIKKDPKDLLFVSRNDPNNTQYSEFHMSAGERMVLRISKDISTLKNALILIDEIETGLHPFTQQQLMLELQRIALRNELQIIVTSHSPVILDSVPLEARIFLERTEDNVVEKPAYKDIIQKALYGQSLEKLSLLCEDEMGEYFVLGILDYLNPRLNLVPDDIVVGRDTGKDEFPAHITALGKFGKLSEFVFILDGDAYLSADAKMKEAAGKFNFTLQPLYLPGKTTPEAWAWQVLTENTAEYANKLGIDERQLVQIMQHQNQLYDNAADRPTNIIKNKYYTFCEKLKRDTNEIIRLLSREEVEKQTGDVKIFADELEMQIRNWQSRK